MKKRQMQIHLNQALLHLICQRHLCIKTKCYGKTQQKDAAILRKVKQKLLLKKYAHPSLSKIVLHLCRKVFLFLAHTVCSWKPSWPETTDDVLWAAGYSRSSVFLWRVGHINSWFYTDMQLVCAVIILHADKHEKVPKVLARIIYTQE